MPLLSTKFFAPPPRPTLVPRPRLVARLNQGLARPLTLLSAPAGSGKTTLVSEWRASEGREVPLAWLSLDPEDNDPARFLTYLVTALGTLKPDLVEPILGVLQSPQPLPRQALVTNLINDLGQFTSPFVLVLDDVHVITNDEVLVDLSFFINHLPPQMHLMLLTQVDPHLPLARLRARDQLVEIRASELRFTVEEAESFLRQSMGLTLSVDRVAALEQRTEGWAAGLQLAALVLQAKRLSRGVVDDSVLVDTLLNAFTGSHPYVADYLVEEVLDRQPEPVRTFLLQTSILERLTGDLCDHLTGRSDSQSLLRQLDEANLFIVPLDEDAAGRTGAGWYRYHHLFRDLLRSQLHQTLADQLPTLHRRAAEWYEQHGFTSEAITHALAARDQQQAARIIEQNAMARLMRGDSVRVLNWINSVEPLILDHPWLGIYQSWALLITGKVELIEACLQPAERWMASHGSGTSAGKLVQEMEYHIAAIRTLAAGRRGHAGQSINLARQTLERLPEGETTIRSIITFTLGDQSWSIGDLAEARKAFGEASRMDQAAGSSQIAVLALSSLGVLLTEQGELHRAAENLQAVMQIVTQPNGRKQPVAAVASLGLAGLEYEWNHLDAAEQYAQQALELGSHWGNPDTLANAHLVLARCQHAKGNMTGALNALRLAEALARGPGVTPWSEQRIAAFRVRLWLEQGHFEAADGWVRKHGLHPDDEITYPRQIAYLTLARVLAAHHQADEAGALLDRLLAQFETNEQMGRALELLLLKALILAAQGNTLDAFVVLTRALALGEQEDYMRTFIDEGGPMAALLRQAGSRGIAPKYVAMLLAQFGESAGVGLASRQPLAEPLSDRELEVLRLIAEGLSNQAIAERLIVALGTVKTHTASLYRKLDVTSRTQAVARATELGLL